MSRSLNNPKPASAAPRKLKRTPTGRRTSKPILLLLPEYPVEYCRRGQNPHSQRCWALVPGQVFFAYPLCQRIHQPHQLLVLAGCRQPADDDGSQATSAKRPDGSPEILGHLARIVVQHGAQPSAFETGLRARRQGESLMDRRG